MGDEHNQTEAKEEGDEQNEEAAYEGVGEDGNEGRDSDSEENDKSCEKNAKNREIQYSNFVYKSKFEKLIEELKEARDKDPSSKSLVFSQYSSTLKFLEKELPKHGFEYRTLTGSMSMKQRAKALHDFQKTPPTTIFLLSSRAANCGLNLTQVCNAVANFVEKKYCIRMLLYSLFIY